MKPSPFSSICQTEGFLRTVSSLPQGKEPRLYIRDFGFSVHLTVFSVLEVLEFQVFGASSPEFHDFLLGAASF